MPFKTILVQMCGRICKIIGHLDTCITCGHSLYSICCYFWSCLKGKDMHFSYEFWEVGSEELLDTNLCS
jgi:hypothetical protein